MQPFRIDQRLLAGVGNADFRSSLLHAIRQKAVDGGRAFASSFHQGLIHFGKDPEPRRGLTSKGQCIAPPENKAAQTSTG